MLGSGRPFVLELADARGVMPPQPGLQELQEQLRASGAGMEVLKLQAAPKSILKAIKVRVLPFQRPLQRACRNEGLWLWCRDPEAASGPL